MIWSKLAQLQPKYVGKRSRYLAFIYSGTGTNSRSFASATSPLLATNQEPGLSYICGTSAVPLLGLTLGQVIQNSAQKFGDQTAIISRHQSIRKNYVELESDVRSLAAGFLSLGLERGDRVGIWGTNSYEWCLTQFAAAQAGLILVNINPAYQPKELKYCLNKVGIRAIVSSESFKTQDYYAMMDEVMPELSTAKPGALESKEVPSLKHVIMLSEKELPGAFKFGDIFNAGSSADFNNLATITKRVQPDDPVNIQFTSGTTGNPKGATLTHHNIVNNAFLVGRRLGYSDANHTICCSVPLYHCFGCVLGTLCGFFHGAKVVLPAPHFDGKAALEAIETEKCTSAYGTPTMFVDMLNVQRSQGHNISSLSTGIMGGSPCPQELCKAITKELNMTKFVVAYGSTETSPLTFLGFPDDSFELKTSTVGHVLDHVEAKVVDENGEIVPFGKPGEICTRGFQTMLGYWGDEEKTKEAISPDRWFHTGDQAILPENGYAEIVGRIKDMVIRGGENIYPREIEETLHKHEKIIEAQVVGVPDHRMGEELCAWIRTQEGETLTQEEVKEFCKLELAHFKIPRYVLFVDSFPITVTGKIQKFIMREQSIEKLNIGQEKNSY